MPFDSKDLTARSIQLSQNETGTLMEINVPMEQQWLFYYQESGSGGGSGSIEVQTGTELFNLSYTVEFGPGTGDYLTGQGPTRFVVSCDNFTSTSVLVRGYLTTEGAYAPQTGQLTHTTSIGTGSYTELGPNQGYIPAPFNRYTLFSNADANGLDIRFTDAGGVVQGSYSDVLADGKPIGPLIFPSPFKISARANTSAARVSIVYYRE